MVVASDMPRLGFSDSEKKEHRAVIDPAADIQYNLKIYGVPFVCRHNKFYFILFTDPVSMVFSGTAGTSQIFTKVWLFCLKCNGGTSEILVL
jgi:hypothetical protein